MYRFDISAPEVSRRDTRSSTRCHLALARGSDTNRKAPRRRLDFGTEMPSQVTSCLKVDWGRLLRAPGEKRAGDAVTATLAAREFPA